ncbi:aminotransferase-like domain-containing protein [Bacillus changyiensis]|uniref:aminotransferase-like domain-containing protein n=1 Tax=Bacillus changyiensis TaxID=3004103 RepID=UPI0022E256FE|nr:PLP-dependent aminotransferase family protein [Bacillus changyiensis]MDA1478022.1 PLP-dependent aminotransferase family protein [Bacillus changyiensis]
MNRNPKYQEIINYIKQKISNGEFPIGSKIPSQRQLAELFNVNRSTVIIALEELAADGLIEGRMGKANFVINNTWTLLTSTSAPDWNHHVKSGSYKPSINKVQEINTLESNNNLIQLSKGELSPEMFPIDEMKQVIGRVTESMNAFGYEEPKGYLPLRQALSKSLVKNGINANPSSILIVSGALQALQLISVGLLKKGGNVLLEKPSYLYSLHVFQSSGINLKGIPLDEQGLTPSAINKSMKKIDRAILYTIPCFQNPTGVLMTEKRRKEILRTCEKYQLPIIEDDIYRDLWIEEPPPLPLKSYDRNGHVLYLSSMSKTLTPGLRIGWIVGPDSVIERLSDIKMQVDYGSSSLSQRVATEWLTSGLYNKHLMFVRNQLKIRRELVIKALKTYLSQITTWIIPKGGLFIWVRINSKVSIRAICSEALSKGILLNPGNIYAQDSGKYLRLSYAYVSLEELEFSIYQIGHIIKKLSK